MMRSKTTFGDWLNQTTVALKQAGIESARLDALILLEDTTGLDRAHILAHPETALTAASKKELDSRLNQRLKRVPLAYIRGFFEFYGRRFMVNNNVLIPRPESESFIDLLKDNLPKKSGVLLDVGTGSGCLAISAKLEYPELKVYASDVSKKALEAAAINAKILGAKISLMQADLIPNQVNNIDYILANLPYVPADYLVSPEVLHEPPTAIFSGQNGLHDIKLLAPKAFKSLAANGLIFIESLREQQIFIQQEYLKTGFKFKTKTGLIQCFQKT